MTTTDMIDPEKELSELQIRAYSALVEDVTIDGSPSKLLHLTNSQGMKLASKIQSVEHFCLSMGIEPKPQFVIVLSRSTAMYCKGSDERAWTAITDEINPDCFNSEAGGIEGLNQTEHRLAIFMRECLLPLATRTHALVIVEEGDQDSLGRVWGDICAVERRRSRDGKLPFNVLSITTKVRFMVTERCPGSIPHQFYQQSPRWRRSSIRVRQAMKEEWTDTGDWFEQHPTSGCTHYIVVDGINDNGQIDYGPWVELSAKIVQQISADITSLAIMSLSTMWTLGEAIDRAANYVGRNVPLLLLDTRTWHAGAQTPASLDAARANLLELEEKLNAEGTSNFYWNATFSYLHVAIRQQLRNSSTSGFDQKGRPLWQVLEQLRRNDDLEGKAASEDCEDKSELDKCKAVGSTTVTPKAATVAAVPNWDSRTQLSQASSEASKPDDAGAGVNAPASSQSVENLPRMAQSGRQMTVHRALTAPTDESPLELCSRAVDVLFDLSRRHYVNCKRLQPEFERNRFASVLAGFEEAREDANPLAKLDKLVSQQSVAWKGKLWYLGASGVVDKGGLQMYESLPTEHPELFQASDVLWPEHHGLAGKVRFLNGKVGLASVSFESKDAEMARFDKTMEVLRAKISEWSAYEWIPGVCLGEKDGLQVQSPNTRMDGIKIFT